MALSDYLGRKTQTDHGFGGATSPIPRAGENRRRLIVRVLPHDQGSCVIRRRIVNVIVKNALDGEAVADLHGEGRIENMSLPHPQHVLGNAQPPVETDIARQQRPGNFAPQVETPHQLVAGFVQPPADTPAR